MDQIRHAYLHYLLDMLPLKYTETVSSKHALGDYALGSSVLEQQYKDDFMLLTTECLIKAIESRLDRETGGSRPGAARRLRDDAGASPSCCRILKSRSSRCACTSPR